MKEEARPSRSAKNWYNSLHKFASAYVTCLKVFFGYDKFSSVSAMLMDLELPSCNTIMLNAKTIFVSRLRSCPNKFVSRLRSCPNKFIQAVNCKNCLISI